MTRARPRARRLLAAGLTFILAGAAGQRAQPAPPLPSESEILTAARDVMRAARFCSLITLDSEGHPQARIMDPFSPEEDFTVWMATNSGTRKVAQLEADGRATLVYFDAEGVGYVSLLGTAEVVRDPAEKALHWKDDWVEFYEDGHRGEDFVLIRFQPHRVDVMSLAHGVASEPRGWKPAVVRFGSRP